jgi:alpha/beta superfamily hydrolase
MVERNELLRFPGANGQQLSARLDRPRNAPRAYALFAHCFTCSKDSLAATHISRSLAALGVAVLRFDFTGLGGSTGDFADTNFSSNVADLMNYTNVARHLCPALELADRRRNNSSDWSRRGSRAPARPR